MVERRKRTKRAKGLTGADLEWAVVQLASTDPSLVAWVVNGVEVEGIPSPMLRGRIAAPPATVGRKTAIDPAELPDLWQRARERVHSTGARETDERMAEELSAVFRETYDAPDFELSVDTIKRYRRRYSLPRAA